jgi:hypothetical protein
MRHALPKRSGLLTCCAAAAFALAGQAGVPLTGIKRVYVEPFSVKNGSEKLRADVIEHLHKLPGIALVANKSEADATLSGDGEIWVKGYRSLNPRSGRQPSNGTPVYSGFLSVELKDAQGDTLWSYLATPGSGADDVAKDLSKRIAKHLAEALASAPH